jgi:HTH-type transcriptional regulator / antitoxin HigA
LEIIKNTVNLKILTKINEKQYREAEADIEKLLHLVDDNTPIDDPNLTELKRVSAIVEDNESEDYPIGTPSLREVIELR